MAASTIIHLHNVLVQASDYFLKDGNRKAISQTKTHKVGIGNMCS